MSFVFRGHRGVVSEIVFLAILSGMFHFLDSSVGSIEDSPFEKFIDETPNLHSISLLSNVGSTDLVTTLDMTKFFFL